MRGWWPWWRRTGAFGSLLLGALSARCSGGNDTGVTQPTAGFGGANAGGSAGSTALLSGGANAVSGSGPSSAGEDSSAGHGGAGGTPTDTGGSAGAPNSDAGQGSNFDGGSAGTPGTAGRDNTGGSVGGSNIGGTSARGGTAGKAGNGGGGAIAVCGNHIIEAGEDCDDGNALPLDGCSTRCQLEPRCTAEAGCTARCGDGVVFAEACDDGNTEDGDGCSSACTVEPGFTCNPAPCEGLDDQCILRVPAIFRDFNGSTATGGHPDFAVSKSTPGGAVQGLVDSTLDADGKPRLLGASTAAFLHGTSEFAEWYRDGGRNRSIGGEIVLWADDAGRFVNRWGAHGERWVGYPEQATWCANTDCSACDAPPDGLICLDDCKPQSIIDTSACFIRETRYDGNPLFFPIDSAPGILSESRLAASVPEPFGWIGYPKEARVAEVLGVTTPIATATAPFPATAHNFNFTTEAHLWFVYDATQPFGLDFIGDDDVWVFINRRLALDLGGFHVPLNGTFRIAEGVATATVQLTGDTPAPTRTSTGTASALGLAHGGLYEIAVFHAERAPDGSTFTLGISGSNIGRSACTRGEPKP